MSDFQKNFDDLTNTPDTTGEYDSQDIQDNKIYAVLACFGILFFVPLVAKPQSKFGRFWANQGFIMFLFGIVCAICAAIIGKIPVIGSIIATLIQLLPTVYLVISLVYTIQGKAKEVPIIGGLLHVFDKKQ